VRVCGLLGGGCGADIATFLFFQTVSLYGVVEDRVGVESLRSVLGNPLSALPSIVSP
jgi:hypothetical protein